MNNRLSLLSITLLLLASALPEWAQTFRGGIAGIITDGSVVKAVNSATGLSRSVLSTSAGEFTFQDLPLGVWQVTVSHPGFETTVIGSINVEVGQIVNLPLKMGVASVASVVQVEASSVAVDTVTATLNTVVPTKAVQEIPLNGRDFTQLVKLTPGVVNGSVNGARSAQNNWQIDGADNNDLWQNSAAVNQGGVAGIAGTLLPIEAIDQFSVTADGTAEYGRNGGGSINMVIKSGTNALHGSLFYFNRNDALAVTPPFSTYKPKLKNNQFGTSLGGPVLKNKLFYFLTYERQKLIAGNSTPATEPSAAYVTSATAVLNRYGVAVNPVATNLLSFWPVRGRTGPAAAQNFVSTDDSNDYSDNGIMKLDYVVNEKNNLSFRYFIGTGTQAAPIGSAYHEYYQVVPSHMHNFSLVYNTVVSPRAVNQVLAAVNYFLQNFNDFDNSFNPIAAGLNTGVTDPALGGAPILSINGFDSTGPTPPLGRIDTTGHITDTLTLTAGKHQFRAGGEYRRSHNDVYYQRSKRGSFTFDGTQGPWATDNSIADPNIRSLADFLAGYVSTSSIVFGDLQRIYDENAFEFFAQDTFQVTKRLSLNYGARYTDYGPLFDPSNRISTFIPSGGGIVFTSSNHPLYPAARNDVGPRIGFAYSAFPRLVVRGGYGVFYDVPNLNTIGDNRPANSGAAGVNANPAGANPVYTLTRSNYTIVSGQPIFGTGNIPAPPYGAFSVSQDFKTPSLQNFNLTTQWQVSSGAVFQLGYVGSLGHHLLVTRDINQSALSALGTKNTRALAQVTRPYNATFPQYATINEVQSIGNSHYNSLQASLRTSAWHGVGSQLSYTYGHSIDDASPVRGTIPMNSNNLKQDYGSSSFDNRHTFNSYVTYDVPKVSKGPKLLVNGWQMNALVSLHSGSPFSVTTGTNVSGTFEGGDRASVTADPFSGVDQSLQSRAVQWFNKAAFTTPAAGTYGNLGRDVFNGPGFNDVDYSLFKNTPVTERISTQFRVEVFNIANRINLGSPSASLSSGSFGKVTSTAAGSSAPGIGPGEPRNIQLALKVIF
jgi:hypothetical protein